MIGEILSMEYKDNRQRPVAYFSKLLNKTECNYKIYDKEMLVITRGSETWKHLLQSAKFKFEV